MIFYSRMSKIFGFKIRNINEHVLVSNTITSHRSSCRDANYRAKKQFAKLQIIQITRKRNNAKTRRKLHNYKKTLKYNTATKSSSNANHAVEIFPERLYYYNIKEVKY